MRRISSSLIVLNMLLLVPVVASAEIQTQSVERFASERRQTVRNSTIAGTWRGEWSTPEGFLYTFEARLTVSSRSNVSGSITWTLVASPRSQEQSKIGLSAIEYVGGTYNLERRLANIVGRSKDDPRDVISIDQYRILVAEDGQSMSGESRNHGNWQGRLSGRRIE